MVGKEFNGLMDLMWRYVARLVRGRKNIVVVKQRIHKVYKQFVPTRWRTPVRWVWGIALVSGVLWWQAAPSPPPLTVYFYDVGQGDAIHIRTAEGFDVLIDGGPTGRLTEKLGRTMPFWDDTIELLVLTHPHADHVTGQIEVLKRFTVGKVLATGVLHTTDEYLAWLQEITKQKIPMTIVKQGEKWEIGEASLAILWPRESFEGKRVAEGKIGEGGGLNDTSVVAKLTYRQTSFLFMGDATSAVERKLLASGYWLVANVLKVGHHGSKYSTSREFLKAVAPRYAVIQVGENRYGHPAFAALHRLEQAKVEILRNDQEGDVIFESDGVSVVRSQ